MSIELIAQLRAHADQDPGALAYRQAADGATLSYAELLRRAEEFAGRLSLPGETVVPIVCPNACQSAVALLGTWMADCCAFPISPESTPAERRAFETLPPPPAGTRLLLQSSGTTGRPRIVCRSGESLNAVCRQMCTATGIAAKDQVLAVAPLCHSYGLEHGLLMPIWAGAAVHLCPGFDLPLSLRELEQSAITFLPGVPAMYEMICTLATRGSRWPSLRRAYSAGAPLPRKIFDGMRDQFDVHVSQLYGATEVGSITFDDPDAPGFDPATVGQPMDGVELHIDGEGESGIVCVRARSMFSRYLDDEASPLQDGFFATGDLGRIDATGRLTIAGRLSLLIDVGGLKVNPAEVEQVLAEHPAVAAAVVVPLKQSETVWRIKAVLTPREADHPPDGEALRRFARERLAAFKVPRVFEIRSTLPRTASGKILRHLVDA
jgi:acyl-CoA synthetase (AMP-forming)/AMP-acid ligase II